MMEFLGILLYRGDGEFCSLETGIPGGPSPTAMLLLALFYIAVIRLVALFTVAHFPLPNFPVAQFSVALFSCFFLFRFYHIPNVSYRF